MTATNDTIRAERVAQLAAKVARLRARADRLEAEAARRPYGRGVARRMADHSAGARLWQEAQELRKRADWLEQSGVRVKGDAERARQAERDANDARIRVGDAVDHFVYGAGTVVRVNRNTYTVQYPRWKTTIDKSLVTRVHLTEEPATGDARGACSPRRMD